MLKLVSPVPGPEFLNYSTTGILEGDPGCRGISFIEGTEQHPWPGPTRGW